MLVGGGGPAWSDTESGLLTSVLAMILEPSFSKITCTMTSMDITASSSSGRGMHPVSPLVHFQLLEDRGVYHTDHLDVRISYVVWPRRRRMTEVNPSCCCEHHLVSDTSYGHIRQLIMSFWELDLVILDQKPPPVQNIPSDSWRYWLVSRDISPSEIPNTSQLFICSLQWIIRHSAVFTSSQNDRS